MTTFAEASPWIVAAIGWGATHIFSEARERRKEIRSLIDEKVLERLAKVEELAIDFHCGDSFDPQKAHTILSELNRTERALINLTAITIDNLNRVIIHHRRAITYKNFDKTSFVKQEVTSDLIFKINAATQDFEDEIETQYRISYPPKFPYFKTPWS